jgi:hypothetical protein
MVNQDLPLGRQLVLPRNDKETILTSGLFRLSTPEGSADFAELGGITSEVENTEYMYTTFLGPMFARQAGRSKPPTITLKRAMRTGPSTTWLWEWHREARLKVPTMRREATLALFAAGDDFSGVGRVTYMLVNAWPAKIEITGVKTGHTEIVYQNVTLLCEDLLSTDDLAMF